MGTSWPRSESVFELFIVFPMSRSLSSAQRSPVRSFAKLGDQPFFRDQINQPKCEVL